MRSLKVLFVINGLGRGGTERSLAEMLPRFADARIKPVVACFRRYPDGVESDVRRQGGDVRFLQGSGFASRVRSLRRIVAAERPDLIHTSLFESDLLGRMAAVGLPARVMSSLASAPYDPVRLQDPGIRAARLRGIQMIDAWTARNLTTHFHAVSQAAKNAAVAALKLSPDRITTVERGRDPIRLGRPDIERRRRARVALNLREDDEVIVNVGRQEYAKGQGYLLEAMAHLAHRRPRLRLLIVGREGGMSKRLNQLYNRHNLGQRAQFLGHRDDVPEILAAADLFVFPSLYEGLPGAVLEAMALGLPVVASDIAPVREVVEEGRNALLVKPASSCELAAFIEILLDDPDRMRAYGERSREIFEERFTLDRSVSRMIELYYRVAEMRK